MDLNVCSRRVHDGYATIRSRGRSRPRAVYRSDSEELLKDTEVPYALTRVSNDPLSSEQIHQVPRWSDTGKNKLSENYGTLRRGKKILDSSLNEREEKIVLNTFSSSKNPLDREQRVNIKINDDEINDCLYDTVASENSLEDEKKRKIRTEIGKNLTIIQSEMMESLNNLYDNVTDEKSIKILTRRNSEIIRDKMEITNDHSAKINVTKVSRQPIYAVPNIPRRCNDDKFDSRLTNDGNYVPSGDLYRTTARYIEDINRNIAEIDKSYEELHCSSNSSSLNSAYGVINKLPKTKETSIELIDESIYSGFHRKRDILAPMPPISPNFGENTESPLTPILTKNKADTCNDQASRFDFKITRNSNVDTSREYVRIRPNSYGKLPPKLLPRSSSMENNSSRHSTGSTTTSSSTKSTESLYAINETLRELTKNHEAIVTKNCEIMTENESHERHAMNDVSVTKILRKDRKKDAKSLIKVTFPKTLEDDVRRFCKEDLRHVIDSRQCEKHGSSRDDETTRIIRDKCKINCRSSSSSNNARVNRKSEDSMTLSVKDQRSCYNAATRTLNVKNKPAAGCCTRSRSRCVDPIVRQDSSRINDSRASNKTRNYDKTISDDVPSRSCNEKRVVNYNSTGTIRRNRCSSRINDTDDYHYDDDDDEDDNNDEETLLISKNDNKPNIINSQDKFCTRKNSDESMMKKQSDNCASPRDEKRDFFEERRYDTLPYRRTKNLRPLHKSSEDVLDSERKCRDDMAMLQRSCISTMDVRGTMENRRDARMIANDDENIGSIPLYLMDATELIIHGQTRRNIRDDVLSRNERMDYEETSPNVSSNSIVRDDVEDFFSDSRNERSMKNRFSAKMTKSRTRHNSLESDDIEASTRKNGSSCNSKNLSTGGFATLPRRGNCGKEQRASADSPRRLSGNVPVLEPLYEHAVSDPVKPRTNDNNVIPWWELATRKYRHRSCPALQDHVVQAFEQSLSNMNQRLKQLTATAEKKDSELQELRETIERLRKQSAEAGLNGAATNGRRHTLGDSDSGTTGCAGYSNNQGPTMARQLSADSVTSLNSLSSACSASSHRKKKGWLGSFSKKFSRARKNRHGSVSDAEDCKDGGTIGDMSAPNSPRLPTAAKHDNSHNHHNHSAKANGQKTPEHENSMTGSKSSSALYKKDDEDVDDLKEQLRQKDLVLTEITLEALKSSGELHSLKEKIADMKNEMKNLRENNERLQRLVTSKSLTSSQSSMPTDPERRYSMTEVAYSVAAMSNGDHNPNNSDQMEDINGSEHSVVSTYTTTTTSETVIEQDTDGKRINVAVYLGSEKSFNVNLVSSNNEDGVGEPPHCVIASVCISNKTTWDALDNTVRRCFKDYVSRVDPVTNLGLVVDHVAAYHLGESSRFTNDTQHPELLPCGYLIGHVKTIYLVLTGYSWLAIDTLIPKSIVQRLLSLLTEHRRLILCGPSGTGKNYLAGKLAHALVDADSDADAKDAAAVATFNVDHKSSKELRQYLAHIAERCDSNAADELPKVIILENLQHAASLGELFSGLLGTRHSSCPAIIGTMSQATCSTTNLQLHHNFRWVLCRKDMEPVKGFLGRYLRRKLLEQQLRDTVCTRNAEMAAVVEWLPRVWLHLNKFLETHGSSDVTIGPSLFLSCPMEVAGSQVWFTDLWNYSIRPYLVEAVKEGNGEAAWEDPAQFITTSYPWIATHAVHGGRDALLRLRPEDVGYDVVSSGHNSGVGASSVKSLGSTHSDTEGDPLLNMLMRLQEAANYSSPHSNDSDSVTSMDSSHTRHSEDLSTSTSSSRGVESAL